MTGKIFVVNDTNERVYYPMFGLSVEPKSRLELLKNEWRCMSRNCKLEIDIDGQTFDYKEYLENTTIENQIGDSTEETKKKKCK